MATYRVISVICLLSYEGWDMILFESDTNFTSEQAVEDIEIEGLGIRTKLLSWGQFEKQYDSTIVGTIEHHYGYRDRLVVIEPTGLLERLIVDVDYKAGAKVASITKWFGR